MESEDNDTLIKNYFDAINETGRANRDFLAEDMMPGLEIDIVRVITFTIACSNKMTDKNIWEPLKAAIRELLDELVEAEVAKKKGKK